MAVETVQSWLPAAMTLTPLAAPVLIYAIGRRSERLRDTVVLLASGAVMVWAAMLFPAVRAGKVVVCPLGQIIAPLGVGFRVDILSFFVTFVSATIWFLVAVYSLAYMKGDHDQTRYYAFFLLTLAGAMGSFMAADLFTLFLFFEVMSLPAYVLVIHDQTAKAMQAGLKYLFMTIAGSLAFFFGLVATHELAGTLSLSEVGVISQRTPLAGYTFFAFVVAFGMKAGMVPLHVWLSDAHPVAPSPASALLSGIMLKTGAYGLLRVIYNLFGVERFRETGWANWLLGAAAFSIVLGSAVAITQNDLKRRLAYSSIGQMGYILLGMALLTERALVGDIFHIFAHAVVKSCLFLCAGAIIRQTGTRDIREFAGMGLRMPITMGCFTLAALTITGIPPMNGFISEWELSLGAFDAGKPWYAVLLLVSSLMNAVYYLPVIISAFFVQADGGTQARAGGTPQRPGQWLRSALTREAPPAMLAPVVVLALACVLFSLMPSNWPLELSEMAARMLMGR
jgi:multicomponent Na+:H+ antiporter subunit D